MPRISDDYLNCVVYLYRSKHEAEEAINIGGSGFMVSVPAKTLPAPAGFCYAVTNRHVIEQGGCVLRINTRDGKFDTLEMKRSDWRLSDTDDLAICKVPEFDGPRYQIRTVGLGMFLSEDQIESQNIGPGDEIILIGRFINQEGKEKNIPTVRFGHLSQMPKEPIEYDGRFQDSFLCEIKSIGGFSGAPVFLAPTTVIGRPDSSTKIKAWLLGIDWAHVQNFENAIDAHGDELPNIRYPSNTGMMAVVPAWKLVNLINHPEEREFRKMIEDTINTQRKAPKVATDFRAPAEKTATDENPNHQEDFKNLLTAAAQKQKPAE